MPSKKELTVVAALIKVEGKALLCQRKEDDAFGLFWEFPGGKVEPKETKKEAIKREIKEELGLDIEAGELKGVFEDEIETLKIKVFLYEAKVTAGKISCLDCRDYGFFGSEKIKGLNLAPVDKKIFSCLEDEIQSI